MPPNTCSHPVADTLNARSVANVQDYARLQGHEVHLSAHNIDPTIKVGGTGPRLPHAGMPLMPDRWHKHYAPGEKTCATSSLPLLLKIFSE